MHAMPLFSVTMLVLFFMMALPFILNGFSTAQATGCTWA